MIACVYKKSRKKSEKRGWKEGRSYFRSPQKYECHSHIAPFDKKEWHSSFAPNFGSGTQEWRSKEWRSLTHCNKIKRFIYEPKWIQFDQLNLIMYTVFGSSQHYLIPLCRKMSLFSAIFFSYPHFWLPPPPAHSQRCPF